MMSFSKKGDGIYSKLLADTQGTPPFLFLKGNVHLLNEKFCMCCWKQKLLPIKIQ